MQYFSSVTGSQDRRRSQKEAFSHAQDVAAEFFHAIEADEPFQLTLANLVKSVDMLVAFADGGFPDGKRFTICLHEVNQLNLDVQAACDAIEQIKPLYHVTLKNTSILLESTREALQSALA